MAGVDAARRARGPSAGEGTGGGPEFFLRIVSAVVLAPLAVGAAYIGGWPFTLFWAIAAIGILWEWASLVAGQARRAILVAGGAVLAGAAAASLAGYLVASVVIIAGGGALAAVFAKAGRHLWHAGGVVYAGLALVLPVMLRADAGWGFVAIIFLFAVVWATDICAYFVGRAVGGPKLVPRLSPKKTWSGAVGGAAAAVGAGLAVATAAGLDQLLIIAVVCLVLSVAAQAGDLLESAVKRAFGAKDASHLIPGHGGLMDRLDGFLAAALAAATIGVLRGGMDSPARGLLLW